MNKIGFACMFMDPTPRVNRSNEKVFEQYDNCKVGTIKLGAYERLSISARATKLREKVLQNIRAINEQLKRVALLPEHRRFMRIGSDIFPFFDHSERYVDYTPDLLVIIANSLKIAGDIVRNNNIRVSSHPSQFTTLSSDKEYVIDNALRTIRTHKMMFELMGLTPDDGVVINIHCNGQSFTLPEDKIQDVKDWISLENDEKQAGHNKTLSLCEKYGIRYVFDVHHYWCENGVYLDTNSTEFKRILATWPANQTPKFHLSQSRTPGGSKLELMAHSDFITDIDVIEQAKTFIQYGDIMVEAKMKNLASHNLSKIVHGI